MAGLPHPRTSIHFATWPKDLQGAALLLGVGAVFYWSSFVLGRIVFWMPLVGILFLDLVLVWIAVLFHIAAWPRLWAGLRDLRARRPRESHPVLAYRAFQLTLGLVFSAMILVPLQYRSYASTDAWLLVIYLTTFPYLAWTFVPLLALHGIVFGRVANYLDSASRRLADLGAALLFAVAGASTAVILQNPNLNAFVDAWTVGRGLLPGAALVGYLLIAAGLTFHLVPVLYRSRHGTFRSAR